MALDDPPVVIADDPPAVVVADDPPAVVVTAQSPSRTRAYAPVYFGAAFQPL